jgi:hypothetical protein
MHNNKVAQKQFAHRLSILALLLCYQFASWTANSALGFAPSIQMERLRNIGGQRHWRGNRSSDVQVPCCGPVERRPRIVPSIRLHDSAVDLDCALPASHPAQTHRASIATKSGRLVSKRAQCTNDCSSKADICMHRCMHHICAPDMEGSGTAFRSNSRHGTSFASLSARQSLVI